VPVEPPATSWEFSLERAVPGEDLVGVGADLEPGTLLAGYRAGLFPMGLGRGGRAPIGWWSPDPRGVIPLDGLRVTRSLRAATRRFRIGVDEDFTGVVRGCADRRRPGAWITSAVARAYGELHRLGWAHSVEAWLPDGRLAGGLYGVAIGGLFAGESMFHAPWPEARDASKVALVSLVGLLRADDDARRLLDVQWRTEHLATLGCVDVPREDYLARLADALRAPSPAAFDVPGTEPPRERRR
jgi:leucyl/phenylalanyl-tRNA--protein transferase